MSTNREVSNGGIGGKLSKNNTISTASIKPTSNFEGWATKQGGAHKSWKKRYFLLAPSVNSPKAADLYYFKSDKSKSAIGYIRITDRTTVKEVLFKGKGPCIEIASGMIGSRTYFMHCASPVEQEKFTKALIDKINALKSKNGETPLTGANVNVNTSHFGGAPAAAPAVVGAAATPAASAGAGPKDGTHLVLEATKNNIPFLTDGERVIEFWQIWTDSIPNGKDNIAVSIVINSDLNQLSWRVSGPQGVLIQDMVDFFWNVGAPEAEIDKLNDVGGLINPLYIGSWIDMSTKGGMDGGWIFPVNVSTSDALKACDEGLPLTKLTEWMQSARVIDCTSVGRDMGASPPRQTEIKFKVNGTSFEQKFSLFTNALQEFGFPPLPLNYIDTLNYWRPATIEMSIITSSDGFVRIGIILPEPDNGVLTKLCNESNQNPQDLLNFQKKMNIERPSFVEIQHLMESFGYGVYNEGWNVVFHYKLDPHML